MLRAFDCILLQRLLDFWWLAKFIRSKDGGRYEDEDTTIVFNKPSDFQLIIA